MSRFLSFSYKIFIIANFFVLCKKSVPVKSRTTSITRQVCTCDNKNVFVYLSLTFFNLFHSVIINRIIIFIIISFLLAVHFWWYVFHFFRKSPFKQRIFINNCRLVKNTFVSRYLRCSFFIGFTSYLIIPSR